MISENHILVYPYERCPQTRRCTPFVTFLCFLSFNGQDMLLLYLYVPRYIVIMFQVFFPMFLKSQVYYKYLTEQLNSISGNPSSQALSASGGSEDDIQGLGAQSEESSHLVNSPFGSDADLTEHPDALWHRPNPG